MTIFLLTALVFALAVTGMALGVFVGRPPLGRCGDVHLECAACVRPCSRREAARRATEEKRWNEP